MLMMDNQEQGVDPLFMFANDLHGNSSGNGPASLVHTVHEQVGLFLGRGRQALPEGQCPSVP